MIKIDEKKCHKAFGAFIREKRKALDLSQEDVAEIFGVSQAYISYLERGEREVDVVEIVKYCLALNIDMREFVDTYR